MRLNDIEIEFEHIWREVQHQRWHALERFYFSFACYREGWLGKNGQPCWQSARENAPLSEALRDTLSCHPKASSDAEVGDNIHSYVNRQSTKSAVLEPLIPYTALTGFIKQRVKQETVTRNDLQQILNANLRFMTITRAEKQRLVELGLENRMPSLWYQNPSQHAPLCRLHCAGIYPAPDA
ncbi:hypothetical protein HGP28_07180 [Vibrio sp. SM6]|uniref:Uncharacterized protein n=1 Tax=Vibrio agarilyticus TaxID=2726741 RepID=A0A7X8TPR9_9VIBR|nr:hypothetical protein [Vibrio agarilyticus]NLS12687.1 hypothetical protein [Vibrio agarilyticus]